MMHPPPHTHTHTPRIEYEMRCVTKTGSSCLLFTLSIDSGGERNQIMDGCFFSLIFQDSKGEKGRNLGRKRRTRTDADLGIESTCSFHTHAQAAGRHPCCELQNTMTSATEIIAEQHTWPHSHTCAHTSTRASVRALCSLTEKVATVSPG